GAGLHRPGISCDGTGSSLPRHRTLLPPRRANHPDHQNAGRPRFGIHSPAGREKEEIQSSSFVADSSTKSLSRRSIPCPSGHILDASGICVLEKEGESVDGLWLQDVHLLSLED